MCNWDLINCTILIAQILLIFGAILVLKKSNIIKSVVFMGFVAVVNLVIYTVPFLYERMVVGVSESMLMNFLESISGTIKQFVGEVRTELVIEYAAQYPIYIYIFAIGTALAVVASFSAAISVFGKRVMNLYRRVRTMDGTACDIVVGNSTTALDYAKNNKNVILMLDETVDKDIAVALMDDGYTIIKRNISARFLQSMAFNSKTHYHIIYPNDKNNINNDLNVIMSYIDLECKKKHIHFYVELDEQIIETVQNQIDLRQRDAQGKTGSAKAYREHITLFSRNELIARTFVDQNPITKYIPSHFIKEDTSVNPDVKINVFMLGFGALTRELYKQYVINNQLTVNTDGEYKVFPIDYYIYDQNADTADFVIDGLCETLGELQKNSDKYFTLPDMPYRVNCVKDGRYNTETVKNICDIAEPKADSCNHKNIFNCFIIDTGDVYRNIAVSNKLKQFLDKRNNFHIFLYNSSFAANTDANTTFYGSLNGIFTHEVIVNESLVEFAKTINKEYIKNDPKNYNCTSRQIDEMSEKSWRTSSYFDVCSNISSANNLRLKLNLLGLDYVKDGRGDNIHLIKQSYGEYTDSDKADYLSVSKRNAMLAQEHYRWTAFHLLSDYLPMKKQRIEFEVHTTTDNDGNQQSKVAVVKKNNASKKHSLLTTYASINDVAQYIAKRASELVPHQGYTAKSFDFYINNEMTIHVIEEYFKANKYSVIKK